MTTLQSFVFFVLFALTESRFGQEQIPVAAVVALGDAGFGDPGVAATLAGGIPGSLLAAANPCDKLTLADQIVSQLGTNQQVVDAAAGLVAAETNFNPFVVNKPFVCADKTLPQTQSLRGIVPLVDPAVVGSDLENKNSASSLNIPFAAGGFSQADVMRAQGFSNFTAQQSDGTTSDTSASGVDSATSKPDTASSGQACTFSDKVFRMGSDLRKRPNERGPGFSNCTMTPMPNPRKGPVRGNPNSNENAGNTGAERPGKGHAGTAGQGNGKGFKVFPAPDNMAQNQGRPSAGNQVIDGGVKAPVGTGGGQGMMAPGPGMMRGHMNGTAPGNNSTAQPGQVKPGSQSPHRAGKPPAAANPPAASNPSAGTDSTQSTLDLDFGLCVPTMAFIGGLNGRPTTEFTFIPQDPLVAEGQQEALNPSIITNRICDQLTNVCEAGDGAKAACQDAKAQIEALGTRDRSTADMWNSILGFADADSTVETI